MDIHSPDIPASVIPTPERIAALDRLGDEIAELSAHLEAATARLLDLIREFDRRGGWNTGFRSCAAWLSWRIGLDLGAARERVRVARALGTLPLLAEALARGELSYAKVRAITRVATPETQERLLGVGAAARPPTSSASCAAGGAWTARPRPARPRASIPAGRCTSTRTRTARSYSAGGWSRRLGALLLRALAAARETLYQRGRGGGGHGLADPIADRPTMAQQQADALALLAETALHHELDPGAPGERYQVVVHVDATVAGGSGSAGPVRPRGRARAFPQKRPGAWRATRAAW